MKKFLKVFMIVLAVLLCVQVGAYASESKEIKIFLDGKAVLFDSAPVIENGRTLVPLRAIFEAMGAEVEWDDTTKTVTATRGDVKIRMTIGEMQFFANENTVALDVAAKIINSRTMVPARAIAESFGVDVAWDDEAKAVILSDDDFVKAYNAEMRKTNEFIISASADFSVAFSKGNIKIALGADEVNKITFSKVEMNILNQSYNCTEMSGADKTIVVENGEKVVSEGKTYESIFDDNGADALSYIADEGDYKIYALIDVLSGEAMGVRGYINKNTHKLDKVVVDKELAKNVFEDLEAVFDKDIELFLSYEAGEIVKMWEEIQK